MDIADFVDINPGLTIDQNLAKYGLSLSNVIGRLDLMTTRRGPVYATSSQHGGDMTEFLKVLACCAVSATLVGTAAYGTYNAYVAAQCAVNTSPHIASAFTGVEMGCTAARLSFNSAIAKLVAAGITAMTLTYGVSKRYFFTKTGVDNFKRMETFIIKGATGQLSQAQMMEGPTDYVRDDPAAAQSAAAAVQQSAVQSASAEGLGVSNVQVEQLQNIQRAGSIKRRSKKQRKLQQKKNSRRKVQRQSRQRY